MRSLFLQRNLILSAAFLAGVAQWACNSGAETSKLTSSPPDGLSWGEGGPSFQSAIVEVEGYSGEDPTVREAQDRLPTGSALHSEVILRSCGPLGGVCHNRKEYPDLRSPANFLRIIDAPCNIQSGTPEGVFDRCERTGDRMVFGDERKAYEIGWIELIPGEFSEDDSPEEVAGLHLHLGDPLERDGKGSTYATASFTRSFTFEGKVEEVSYAEYSERWHIYDNGKHLVAEVPDYRRDQVSELLSTGIEQGDLNRNGVFGAKMSDSDDSERVAMIKPGDPERSYMVARLRGHMAGEPVPGTRMPLANPPFSVAEMLSLFCFIEGIPDDGQINLGSDIDYKNCSYADPETHTGLAIEGAGNNWSDRVSPLLEANCGGCHSKERADGDLVLVGEGVYEFLIDTISPTDTEARPLIAPGDPTGSYLFLKLKDDASITGRPMPFDPLEGKRTLAGDELADIEAWILNGAAP